MYIKNYDFTLITSNFNPRSQNSFYFPSVFFSFIVRNLAPIILNISILSSPFVVMNLCVH